MDEYNKKRSRGEQNSLGNDDEYKNLYGDLSEEVQSYLMETHPLNSKTASPRKNRSHRSQEQGYDSHLPTASTREDVDEVREARMQQVGNEINEIRNTPQQEGDPTRHVSRRAKSTAKNMEQYDGNEDFEDGIRYVSVMPSRKKTAAPAGEQLSQTAPPSNTAPSRRRRRKDGGNTDHGRRTKKDSYNEQQDYAPQEFDFEAREKQENLDYLYNDSYAYEDEAFLSGKGKIVAVLFLITVILMVFLLFKTASLSNSLEVAEAEIEKQKTIETKYEALQLEKLQLEEEINALKNPVAPNENATPEDGDGGGAVSDAGESSDLSSTTVYTVMQGDSAWSIAQKVYNNGADFKRILDANNMSENDTVTPGMKLTIPR